jgi:hypothetical protein
MLVQVRWPDQSGDQAVLQRRVGSTDDAKREQNLVQRTTAVIRCTLSKTVLPRA